MTPFFRITLHGLTSGEFRSLQWESFRGPQLWPCSSKGGIVWVLLCSPGMHSISAPSKKCSVFLEKLSWGGHRRELLGHWLWFPAHLRAVSRNHFQGPEEAFPISLPTAPFNCGPSSSSHSSSSHSTQLAGVLPQNVSLWSLQQLKAGGQLTV